MQCWAKEPNGNQISLCGICWIQVAQKHWALAAFGNESFSCAVAKERAGGQVLMSTTNPSWVIPAHYYNKVASRWPRKPRLHIFSLESQRYSVPVSSFWIVSFWFLQGIKTHNAVHDVRTHRSVLVLYKNGKVTRTKMFQYCQKKTLQLFPIQMIIEVDVSPCHV